MLRLEHNENVIKNCARTDRGPRAGPGGRGTRVAAVAALIAGVGRLSLSQVCSAPPACATVSDSSHAYTARPHIEVDTQSYLLVYFSPREVAIPGAHLCVEAHLAVPADALCIPVRSIRQLKDAFHSMLLCSVDPPVRSPAPDCLRLCRTVLRRHSHASCTERCWYASAEQEEGG